MFITLQFPIFDYRFLQPGFEPMERPKWPLAQKSDKMRYVGKVFDRFPPYMGPYDGEKKYCSAKGVINLCGTGSSHFFKALHSHECHSRIIFRRFQSDGNCLSKFEVGFIDSFKTNGNGTASFLQHIEKYLTCPVKIKLGNKLPGDFVPLIEAGKDLTLAYYWASTKKVRTFKTKDVKERVESCEPAAFIHVDPTEVDLSSLEPQKIDIPELTAQGIQLYYCLIPYKIEKRTYHLKSWIIAARENSATQPVYSYEFNNYDKTIRYLRINLLRIHAETVISKRALEAIGNPGAGGGIHDAATRNRVYFYLHKIFFNLSKVKRNDQQQDKLVEKAFRLDTSYYGSESIEDRLEGLKIYLDWLNTLPATPERDQIVQKTKEGLADIQNIPADEVTVFISYNHKDGEVADQIKEFLEKESLKVIIDSASMLAGEDIDQFIKRSIKGSRITLSIVSGNSLSSGWVGRESISSIFLEEYTDNRKFIACYIDDSFFADDFVLSSRRKINEEIAKLDALIQEYIKEGMDFASLDDKRSRLISLRDSMPSIIKKLVGSLSIDIRGEKIQGGLKKVLAAIKGAG